MFENVIKHSKFVKKIKDPRKEFKYWLNIVLEHGIDCLINETYMKKFSWFIVNGYDVSIFYIFVFFIFLQFKFLNCNFYFFGF